MSSVFARRKLLGILSSSWVAQACYAVAKLGLPDAMAAGPRPVAELAAECGADPRVLNRLLRAMVSMGLFRQTAPQTYALTSVTEFLRSDVPASLRQMAVLDGEEVFRSFADIMHTVRTGSPAFESIYGEPFYAYLAGQPQLAATFAEAMNGAQVSATLALGDLTGVTRLVDVGGGSAGLLTEALLRYPALRGVLLELPEAVRQAKTTVTEAGVEDRAELVEGDFFEAVPAGGDAYVLARVLHNWTDERAELILRKVREAMTTDGAPGGRLIVLEQLLPEAEIEPGPGKGMVDLLMLVLMEGHDRTQADYRRLLERAGFALRTVRHGSGPDADSMLEAVPA
ncbi:MAG: methyltransferase [Actinophytocola sp.]|uniref:methyltransferase n=1 Tax=Actinophytocola sp. TaxID=1872138 RepID=UPI0013224B83|nr:methyltransferase [Actinophytocola sp.]MPZ81431.1 methyltransferase [Actinophytocola sp.]